MSNDGVKRNTKSLSDIHAIMRDVGVWGVTGVCSFLAFTVWQISLSVERLVVEISHQNSAAEELRKRMDNVDVLVDESTRVSTLQALQLAALTDLSPRLDALELDSARRDAIRWKVPDMQRWVDRTAALNEGWRPAPVVNTLEDRQRTASQEQ